MRIRRAAPSALIPCCFAARGLLIAVLAIASVPATTLADIIGAWDFSNGWNQSSGLIPAVSAINGLTLSYLPNTPLYQHPQALGVANPPQLQFATTGAFGIGNLGTTNDTVVMRIPDMRGYGLTTGLMAKFPRLVNGEGAPTRLNRFSLVMDVYIPGSTDAETVPPYLTLLQTRLGVDGAWFVDKRTDATGVAASYGGGVAPDRWNRLALVMNLTGSAAESQYQAYVSGTSAASIVPALVPQTSQRNVDLVTRDLVSDGGFSIGSLNDSLPGLGTDSACFLFNADRNDQYDGPTLGELGTLYVANLQLRDDALSAGDVLALGGPAPGLIVVPEPGTLGLVAGAVLAAAASRLPRRRFLGACSAGAAAVRLLGARACGAAERSSVMPQHAGSAATERLSERVGAPDGSTDWTRIAGGDFGTGRFVAAELISHTWRGSRWRHQLAVYTPQTLAVERPPLVLWIDGGNNPDGPIEPPMRQLPILSAIADASGLPAAVVRQVPNQPLEGGRREDDLIAHTFSQFFLTGDPTWPLLVPMVKSVTTAFTAAEKLAAEEWGIVVDGCVVAGASKRGWTSWLTAAIEPRVRGLVPMVIDMLDLPRHMRLQIESFGAPSESLEDYVSRNLHRKLDTPRGHELLDLVDPVRHATAITQPKILALGTNDEYWPLESIDVYRPQLLGPTWVSYTPNAGHDLPPLRMAPLAAALGRHVGGIETLPNLDWRCDRESRTCSVAASPLPEKATVWSASSDTRDFRRATWAQQPATLSDGRYRVTADPPAEGFLATLIECRYDRAPAPLYLSSSPLVIHST